MDESFSLPPTTATPSPTLDPAAPLTPPPEAAPDALQAQIADYYARGFRLIFYPTKQKGPSGAEAKGWTERHDPLDAYRPDRHGVYPNVGVFTGAPLGDGSYLADIDFDWSDGIVLAKHVLPATGFGFGRDSRKFSHAFYATPTPLPSMVFDGIDGKPIVELRGTKQDGTVGLQTMLPPSIHPTGERLVLRATGPVTLTDEGLLPRRVLLYAIACLLYGSFPHREFLHDVRLATAGFLLTEGVPFDDALLVGTAVCEASGNNAADFRTLLQSTWNKLQQGERVQGRSHLQKCIGDDGPKVISRIKEWLGNEEFVVDPKGKIRANHQDNIRLALDKLKVQLSFDVFCQKPLVTTPTYSGPLMDAVLTELWLATDTTFGFRPSKDFFYDVTQNLAHANKFHPVLDYLTSLTWDGEPRLNTWLITAAKAADTEYVRAVSSLMLIAAVRRVTEPGCKFDEMVVLESGQQGLMKSTALRTLCPHDHWFSDDLPLNVDAKQIVERTLGKWLIEASDLSGMQVSRVEQLKGMLSRQVDGPVRLAYGRLPVEQRRQFIIVGTTNSYSYLTDSTGNRRFWPIRVSQFDVPWIKTHRDQLWAEAYVRERAGESIRLSPSLYGYATHQQERRRVEDPWEIAIEEKFPRSERHRLTPEDVWAAIGMFDVGKRDTASNARLLKAMHQLGFRRLSIRMGDKVVKGFARDVEEGQMVLPEDPGGG